MPLVVNIKFIGVITFNPSYSQLGGNFCATTLWCSKSLCGTDVFWLFGLIKPPKSFKPPEGSHNSILELGSGPIFPRNLLSRTHWTAPAKNLEYLIARCKQLTLSLGSVGEGPYLNIFKESTAKVRRDTGAGYLHSPDTQNGGICWTPAWPLGVLIKTPNPSWGGMTESPQKLSQQTFHPSMTGKL